MASFMLGRVRHREARFEGGGCLKSGSPIRRVSAARRGSLPAPTPDALPAPTLAKTLPTQQDEPQGHFLPRAVHYCTAM